MAETTHATTAVAHEGGHAGVFPPFDKTTFASQLVWLAITFVLLYLAISRIIAPRIGSAVEGRAQRIADDISAAAGLKSQTEAAIAAYEKDLAAARSKAGAIAAETRAALNAELEGKRSAAEATLAQRTSDAETHIAGIKAKALGEVDAIAAETAESIVTALSGLTVGRDTVDAAVAAAAK